MRGEGENKYLKVVEGMRLCVNLNLVISNEAKGIQASLPKEQYEHGEFEERKDDDKWLSFIILVII